jgi:hypothetical protein
MFLKTGLILFNQIDVNELNYVIIHQKISFFILLMFILLMFILLMFSLLMFIYY